MNRLITFRPSHYCEKARWALDRAGIAYREESHVPILSWLATFGSGAGRTVPALVTGSGTLSDSTDILRWADAQTPASQLFPKQTPEAALLEDDFDLSLGPATRRLVYFHLLGEPELMRRMLRSSAPAWETRAAGPLFPLIRQMIVRGLRVDAAGAERSRTKLDETFSRVGALLADGRRFLTGDRFTAADLTFAALAYPAVWPDFATQLVGRLEELPPKYRALVEEVRPTAAGKFALRLWDEERTRVVRAQGGGTCHARTGDSAS